MNQQVKDLLKQAQSLSAEQRQDLAEALLESIEEPFDQEAWEREAERRWAEHIEHPQTAIDALEAVEQARKSIRKPAE